MMNIECSFSPAQTLGREVIKICVYPVLLLFDICSVAWLKFFPGVLNVSNLVLLAKERGYCPMGMQLLKQEQCYDERMHCCFDFNTCPTLFMGMFEFAIGLNFLLPTVCVVWYLILTGRILSTWKHHLYNESFIRWRCCSTVVCSWYW